MYAERSLDLGVEGVDGVPDDQLPRDHLDQIYKFGWCTADAVQRNFFRKSVNVTLPTYQDTQLVYIYLLERKHTQKHLQCVIMKAFVPQKFLFLKSRLPLYYCQGVVFILMLNTITSFLHECTCAKIRRTYVQSGQDNLTELYEVAWLMTVCMQDANVTSYILCENLHNGNARRFFSYNVAILLLLAISDTGCLLRDFSICHDNFDLKPADGILKDHTFTWLGFVQYLHVTTGLPHHSKAPRVVLIHKQFAVGTATDMLVLPRNYKRGMVIFGDYEREESDCGLTRGQVKMGAQCPRAYLEIPITEVSPHPEYTRFGVGNSLAIVKLLRPIKSEYMIPVCLPSLSEREKKKKQRFVFMVDYISSVPKDFDTEKMGKKTLKMYTHKECRRHRMRTKLGSEGVTHVLCSSGCGIRPGAPIISHAFEGTFQLMGIAAGGGTCTRHSMRNRLNREPPLYIDVYPYISWIINYITAQILPRPYPDNFMLVEGGSRMGINREFLRARRKQKSGWRARTFAVGDNCFKSVKKQRTAELFYSEKFEVNSNTASKLNIILQISAGIECTIVCVRMLLPNRLTTPVVDGVGGYNITIELNTQWFPYTYYFSLGLYGKNTTERDFAKWYTERKKGFW